MCSQVVAGHVRWRITPKPEVLLEGLGRTPGGQLDGFALLAPMLVTSPEKNRCWRPGRTRHKGYGEAPETGVAPTIQGPLDHDVHGPPPMQVRQEVSPPLGSVRTGVPQECRSVEQTSSVNEQRTNPVPIETSVPFAQTSII